MVEIDDENAGTWYNRGSIHRRLGDYEQAEADLTRSLELRADDPTVLSERAITRLFLDRADDALDDADAAMRMSPDSAYTRLYIARYAGRRDLVTSDASRLIAAEGDGSENLPYLLSVRGLARVESADPDGGMADLDEALRLDPEGAALYDRRGYARLLQGDLAGASSDFDEAIRRLATLSADSRASLHYHRALLLEVQQRPAQALSEIEEAATVATIPSVQRDVEEVRTRLRAAVTGS
jgi:tetratricopeptide (TPR) repeat protein